MDFTTSYLGMTLRSPLVPSASPLAESLDNIRKMEDAGAGAVVLWSLFEEQLRGEQRELAYFTTAGTESFAESLSYFPEADEYRTGPEGYLEHIRKAKEAVGIPIVASLNGSSVGGWTEYARQMAEAGADALELNIYYIPADPELSAEQVEQTYVDIVRAVKAAVTIPVAVKLGPYFSSMANMAHRLDAAGADGLVLFNRFYQPDLDLENLEVAPNLLLSTPQALRLPMRWIAILYGRIEADLAATSGIHLPADAIKVLMTGAKVAMVCSALLKHGIDHLRVLEAGMREWMQEHDYDSIETMQGSMSQKNVANPTAFERAQYMKALASYSLTF